MPSAAVGFWCEEVGNSGRRRRRAAVALGCEDNENIVVEDASVEKEEEDDVLSSLPWRWGAKRMRIVPKEEEDVFSSLLDSIIGHIISFLSIKDIVRTSGVSKRWSRLWTNTQSISYSCSWLGLDLPVLCSSVDGAFSQCSFLTRLHIGHVYYERPRELLFDSWLRSAIARRLPVFFFSYPALQSLHVRGCFFTLSRGRVSWYSLKFMRVGHVEMTDELLDSVLNGTPSLESLELVHGWGLNNIQLDSRKLRALVIDSYPVNAKEAHLYSLSLAFSAPHLSSLQILGVWYGKRKVRVHQVSLLAEVKLDFIIPNLPDYEYFAPLLRDLSSVNSLVVGNYIMMGARLMKPLPVLRLRCPNITLGDSIKGSTMLGLKCLLSFTCHVEKLVLYINGLGRNEKFGLRRPLKPKAWVNHLKTIVVNGFLVTPPDIVRCKYTVMGLLREAVVMEKMVINARGDRAKLEELWRQVLCFPRAYKASKVSFNYLLS